MLLLEEEIYFSFISWKNREINNCKKALDMLGLTGWYIAVIALNFLPSSA
jgi:hypothetical protein